jgi:hypothetical protein
MINFLCRFGFHSFSDCYDVNEVTYVVCRRCGDSRLLHASAPDS